MGRYDRLPLDIEIGIANIIESEVNLSRSLEILRRDLVKNHDYSILSAFRSIDRYNIGRIDSINLGTFLRACEHNPSEIEIIAIIRRVDTDGDACINFNEFSEFL